jgi:hypothetical protein
MEQIVVDGGEFLSDDLLEALESHHLCIMQDEGYLSLHAMLGHPKQKAIQLRATVKNQALIILVDSRSFHTFINSALAQKLQFPTIPIAPMAVRVANGDVLPCTAEIKNFEWWIQGNTFQVDVKVIVKVA